ncbi:MULTISPECIES: efflux RND transporter periplasmic adaptor subunit [unclassified Acinetobacter]|uniref:efflux RND transporter periplasmic adaptor subunit n=1 Tax=unclassified Acinetobacter TaxID=196816 RepID=UPI0035BA98EF
MRKPNLIHAILLSSVVASSLIMVACGKKNEDKKTASTAQAEQPPVKVGVLIAEPQSIESTVELTGRAAAHQHSEVRPQASGIILKKLFNDGDFVRAGQALYQIDDRTNRSNVESSTASLARQQANLNALRVKERRYAELLSSNAVSRQEYDDIVAQIKLAEADIKVSNASLKNSQINLQYSTVRAPISGQTGQSLVTEGALVAAGQNNPLVTIQQLDPIYVDISQSSSELLQLRQKRAQGQLGQSNTATVKLKLEDGSTYPTEGRMTFSGATVNQTTGAVMLRATFPNPQHMLLPGMFVKAEIVQGVRQNVYLVPQTAVGRTATGDATVLVVNAEGKSEVRNVKTVGSQGNQWIVSEGLNTGDKIIVDGIAKVRPGQKVEITASNNASVLASGTSASTPVAASAPASAAK